MSNQAFEKKVSFRNQARPKQNPRDLSANAGISKNVTSNVQSTVIVDKNSQKQAATAKNRGKLRNVVDNMNNQSEVENLKTKVNEEEEEYVYRGPKNTTGIFKNSLILKDLTGYLPEPDNDSRKMKDVNETIDAGTQTIVHDIGPLQESGAIDDSKHLLIYDKNDRNVKTYAGTPERNDMHKRSTMRNSIDEGAGRDNNSVERLESLGLDN